MFGELPINLFNKIDQYWGKNIKYTFPKLKECEYVEDSYPRSLHFSKFIDESHYVLDLEKSTLTFEFMGNENYLIEWEAEDCYNVEQIKYIEECTCTDEEICNNCLLYYFKNTIYETLVNLGKFYKAVTANYNRIQMGDYNTKLGLFEDDNKCIMGCGFIPPKWERNINKIKSLYCNVCIKNCTHLTSEEHKNNYKKYIEGLKLKYESEYDEIIEFLNNPIPLSYKINDSSYDGEIILTLEQN
jgi:hypothetical protein